MSDKLIHADLSHRIIGASMTVLNELKPGLDEKIYENALCIELRHLGHEVDQQSRFPVVYRDNLIGTFVPDLIVDGLVIVDTKVALGFTSDIKNLVPALGVFKPTLVVSVPRVFEKVRPNGLRALARQSISFARGWVLNA